MNFRQAPNGTLVPNLALQRRLSVSALVCHLLCSTGGTLALEQTECDNSVGKSYIVFHNIYLRDREGLPKAHNLEPLNFLGIDLPNRPGI